MGKNNSAQNQDSPIDDSLRPNLANLPKIDDMLALYEKVLSEIDADIASQKNFSSGNQSAE